MENHEYSVGLDIGTTKIVAIVGRRNDRGKIEVLGTTRSLQRIGVEPDAAPASPPAAPKRRR